MNWNRISTAFHLNFATEFGEAIKGTYWDWNMERFTISSIHKEKSIPYWFCTKTKELLFEFNQPVRPIQAPIFTFTPLKPSCTIFCTRRGKFIHNSEGVLRFHVQKTENQSEKVTLRREIEEVSQQKTEATWSRLRKIENLNCGGNRRRLAEARRIR